MRPVSWWKLLGLAGAAGVVATGAVVARAERRRRAYTPEEVREQLHRRHAELVGATGAGEPHDGASGDHGGPEHPPPAG